MTGRSGRAIVYTMRQTRRRLPGTDGTSTGWMRRSLVSWLGLALLLFNLTAGTALPVAAEGALPSLADGRMVVCTAAGMAVFNEDGSPAADHDGFCVFCLPLLHAGGAAPVASVALPVPVDAAVAVLPPAPTRLAPPQRLAGGASPRAPPFA